MKNTIFSLTLAFILGFAIPVYAVEEHNLKFEWAYPDSQNDIINGFRIYKLEDNVKKLVLEVTNTMMRTATKKVVLNKEKTMFYVVPYIGEREGDPSTMDAITLQPFYPINSFIVECPTCGPQKE